MERKNLMKTLTDMSFSDHPESLEKYRMIPADFHVMVRRRIPESLKGNRRLPDKPGVLPGMVYHADGVFYNGKYVDVILTDGNGNTQFIDDSFLEYVKSPPALPDFAARNTAVFYTTKEQDKDPDFAKQVMICLYNNLYEISCYGASLYDRLRICGIKSARQVDLEDYAAALSPVRQDEKGSFFVTWEAVMLPAAMRHVCEEIAKRQRVDFVMLSALPDEAVYLNTDNERRFLKTSWQVDLVCDPGEGDRIHPIFTVAGTKKAFCFDTEKDMLEWFDSFLPETPGTVEKLKEILNDPDGDFIMVHEFTDMSQFKW